MERLSEVIKGKGRRSEEAKKRRSQPEVNEAPKRTEEKLVTEKSTQRTGEKLKAKQEGPTNTKAYHPERST